MLFTLLRRLTRVLFSLLNMVDMQSSVLHVPFFLRNRYSKLKTLVTILMFNEKAIERRINE